MNSYLRILHIVLLFVLFFAPSQGSGTTISYEYDHRLNRLTSVTYGDGTRITYVYDPAGNRLSKAISTTVVPVPGNINGDDSINLTDAILALKVLSGQSPVGIRSDYAGSGADVNSNQRIGAEEVIYILQKVAGIR